MHATSRNSSYPTPSLANPASSTISLPPRPLRANSRLMAMAFHSSANPPLPRPTAPASSASCVTVHGPRSRTIASSNSQTATARIACPKTCYIGQTHVVLPPVEFLRRLAALMPPPRFHTIRYHGLFAPNAKLRPLACALVPGHVAVDETRPPRHACPDPRNNAKAAIANPAAPHRRRTRMLWSQPLRRGFAVDVLRCRCDAAPDRKLMGVLARSQAPDALENFLRAIGETPGRRRAPKPGRRRTLISFDASVRSLAPRPRRALPRC